MDPETREAIEAVVEYARSHRLDPTPEAYAQVIYRLDAILEET